MRAKGTSHRRTSLIDADKERRERNVHAKGRVEVCAITYGPKSIWLPCTQHPNNRAIAVVGERNANGVGLRALCPRCFLWYAAASECTYHAEGYPR